MKNFTKIFFAVLIVSLFFFVGWSKKDSNVLTVGSTPELHAAMLKNVEDNLAEEGITLKVIDFTDYVTPNEALEGGQLDANFFQHLPYMDSFNAERGYHLVNAGGIHIEPVALYSKKISSVDEIKDGATIAIPNDPTNEGRALLLLQSAGLIKLDENAGITATPQNIVENPKNIKFHEIEAASLPRVLLDVDAAVINGNYAIQGGLNPTKDAVILEQADATNPYVNILACRAGEENSEKIQALVKVLKSDEVRNFILSTYSDGSVIPAE